MAGRTGVDTARERSFFNRKPEPTLTKRSLERETAKDVDRTPDAELAEDDQEFLAQMHTLDVSLAELETEIDAAIGRIRISFDPSTRPDLKEAVGYFNSKLRRDIDDPVIDGPVYQAALDTRAALTGKFLGGKDPMTLASVRRGKDLIAQVKAADEETVLTMVARFILSKVLDYLATLIPNIYPLSRLRKTIRRQARKFAETPRYEFPVTTQEEYEKDYNADEPHGFGREDLDEDIIWPIDFRNIRNHTGLPQDIEDYAKDENPLSYAYAETVHEYAQEQARLGDVPDPGVYYAKPIYEAMLRTYLQSKMALSSATATSLMDPTGEPIEFLTDKDKERIASWTPEVYQDYTRELDRLKTQIATPQPLTRVDLWQQMKKAGVNRFQNATEALLHMMRTWQKDPDVICCFIHSINAMGSGNMKMLYSLRAILRFLINGLDMELQRLNNFIPDLFMVIYQGIVALLLSLMEGVVKDAALELDSLFQGILDKPDTVACSPWDDLVSLMAVELPGVRADMKSILEGYVSQFTLSQETYHGATAKLNKRLNLLYWYKIVDRIIKAVETSVYCKEGPSSVDISEPNLNLTTQEINDFIRGQIPDLVTGDPGTRATLAQIFGRDPVTGEQVSSPAAMAAASEELARAIAQCDKEFTAQQLNTITDTLNELGLTDGN